MITEGQNTSPTSANGTDKQESNSNKLVEQFPLSGTPFTIVKVEDHWFLTIGKYRLTNQLNTREEAEAEVHDTSWIRIMQIMRIVCVEYDAEKQLQETIEKQKRIMGEKGGLKPEDLPGFEGYKK